MARLFDDGSSEYLTHVGAPSSNEPLTFACWFNTDNAADVQVLIGLGENGATGHYILYCAGNAVGDPIKAQKQNSAGLADTAESSSGYSTGVWHHACAVFSADTARAAYIDGGNKGTDTANLSDPTIAYTSIGALRRDALNYYMSGSIAEAAIWTAALSDAEVASLAAGAPVLSIQPAAIAAYHNLGGIYGRHDKDLVGPYDMTAVNTPSWADHPTKLWFPNSGIVVPSIVGAPPAGTILPHMMHLVA